MNTRVIVCLFISAVALNCKKDDETLTVQFQIEATSGILILPRNKNELLYFIDKNVSPSVLSSTLSMQPYDILFKRSQLSELLALLYYGRIPRDLFDFVGYPGVADIAYNPANTLAAWIYADKKGISMKSFHMKVIRDKRYHDKVWDDKNIDPKNPWELDTAKWNPDVTEWDAVNGKREITDGGK